MRTGVLADSNAKRFEPMDVVSHERHLGVPHIVTHSKVTRKRKQGYRATPRPRSPYLTHFELSQLMNPENPRLGLEPFSSHMDATQTIRPPYFFRLKVNDFLSKYPEYVNRAILDETAYWFRVTGLNPSKYLVQSARRPLHNIVEQAAQEMPDRRKNLEQAYNESMRLLLGESGANQNPSIKQEQRSSIKKSGVSGNTDARAARMKASGKAAKQERTEQARAEEPDAEFLDSHYAEASGSNTGY